MDPSLKFILIAAFGASCQEVLFWWDLRNNLSEAKYKRLLKSKIYWIVLTLMIFFSAIGTYILCYEDGWSKLPVPLILGASFPALFKKLVSVNARQDLGSEQEESFAPASVLRTYFGL